MFDRTSTLFPTVLLVALASLGFQPEPAQAAAPQHHAQAPGFYRMKVGDLEVTALLDGSAVFDLHWLTARKPAMDRVAQDLTEDPHLRDTSGAGCRVNAGKQFILIDAGAGTWFGGGSLGRLVV